MVADRVPQPGEVWAFRHFRPHGHGFVVVDRVDGDEVGYVYAASGSPWRRTLTGFVREYEFVAGDVEVWADGEGVTS